MKQIITVIFIIILSTCATDQVTETPAEKPLNYNNEATTKNLTSEETSNYTLKSPAGLKIGEFYGSDENEFSFCADGTLKYYHTPRLFELGTWELKNDTIWMFLTEKHQKIGMVDPLPSPEIIPNNYLEEYKQYRQEILTINRKDYRIFSELKNLIEEDEKYPYQILNANLNCNHKDFKEFDN